jgi:ankyrin repeat protein
MNILEKKLVKSYLKIHKPRIYNKLKEDNAHFEFYLMEAMSSMVRQYGDNGVVVLGLILRSGIIKQEFLDNTLVIATKQRHQASVEAVRLLLQFGANPNCKDSHGAGLLDKTIQNGHNEKSMLLINAGADLSYKDPDNLSLLHLAAIYGRLEVARELCKNFLSSGLYINPRDDGGRTPLSWADSMHHNKVKSYIEQCNESLNTHNEYHEYIPLH